MESYKNRIITISGDPASGKGTVAKELEKLYTAAGFKVIKKSVGDIFREVAVEEYKRKFPEVENPSLEQISNDPNFAEELKAIDLSMDSRIKKIGEEFNSVARPNEILIVDSRLAWFNIPGSFAVRLTVDPETAGERVYNDPKRGKEDRYASREQAIADTESRKQSEIARYIRLYNADIRKPENFKLIINTTLAKVSDIALTIKQCEEREQQGLPYVKTWASPELFYATQSCRQTEDEYVWRIADEKERKSYPGCPYETTRYLRRLYPDKHIDPHTNRVDKWVRGKHTLEEMAHLIQESGIFPDEPITASSIENSHYHFVEDGHHRVFGSILASKTLVPYIIIGHKKDEIDDIGYQYIVSHQFERFDGTTFRYLKLPERQQKKEDEMR